ncbi:MULTISPECIES: FAD-dependent monooxygenase [unclassified Amycolatopsis]|uniref:FAD-dependent monooxygenase n=1 Tax=unclassified Amycolatopsis TaxID=2618356 RepID=UPI00106E4B64|nr:MULTISPECIES: FAD-dependent monooxygenase [unclassified Amycolatopsis]
MPTGGSAAVVGGGIGGLAAAIGLSRVGWQVTVFERLPGELDDAGSGISLAANGVRALDALGAGDALRADGCFQRTVSTRSPRGTWLARMDGAELERVAGTPIVGIARYELHRLLRSLLPSPVVREEVTAVEDNAVVTSSGRHKADVIVAADGVNSRLRKRFFPAHPGPVYSGSAVIRAITTEPFPLSSSDFNLTWGRGVEFGYIGLADGRAEWHAVLSIPAGTRYPDPIAEMRRRFGSWHEPITELLDATDPEAVLHHDVYELVTPLPSYVSGRVALLGDAAHAMQPNLGQGACQALEDAVTLAHALSSTDLDTALTRYDAERRPRSQAIARAARQTGRMGQQLTNPAAIAVRNLAFRAMPTTVMARSMLRYTRWQPPILASPDANPQS